MISKTLAAAKQRPVIAMFITVGSLAAAAVAIWNFSGIVDKAVISHAELAQIFSQHEKSLHPAAQEQMLLIRQESNCASCDIQIAILSDVIWRLEQTEPDGQRLNEKRAQMKKLQERRIALKCAELA